MGGAEIHVQCVVYNRHVSASTEQPNFQCVDM